MNLFAEIKAAVDAALGALMAEGVLPPGLSLAAVTVEPPRDPAHGDMATNAAMVLAKPSGIAPRAIAEALADRLGRHPAIARAAVAGPGFLNLTLVPAAWQSVVAAALRAGAAFGRSGIGADRRVNVEFVSANPTGPLHVAHARGAVFGDALAALLAHTGHAVTREYYINDGGSQVDTLARSAHLRYAEAHGRAIDIPAGLYPGDYLVAVGTRLKELFGDTYLDAPEEVWLVPFRDAATDAMMDLIRADLAKIGITMDVFFSEKSLYGTGRIEATLEALAARDLIYVGQLEPPKGKTSEEWEPRPQTLFRSTAYGDDVDRPVRKADGGWTYFAPDIAYHGDKIARGFDLLIDVWGADHGGYVKRMQAAVGALSDGRVPLEVKLCQIVRLFKDGQPYKMSKRAGNFVTLSDLVDEVGAGVTRFVMLTRKNDAALDFDFAKVLDQSRENPVWYVQYAHARVYSVLARAGEAGIAADDSVLAGADLARLAHPAELDLIRKLAEFPRLVEAAALAHEPHRIAFYLYDLASEFHAHWNRGGDEPGLRMLVAEDPGLTQARLAMARAVAVVISAGLGILGVAPMREMA